MVNKRLEERIFVGCIKTVCSLNVLSFIVLASKTVIGNITGITRTFSMNQAGKLHFGYLYTNQQGCRSCFRFLYVEFPETNVTIILNEKKLLVAVVPGGGFESETIYSETNIFVTRLGTVTLQPSGKVIINEENIDIQIPLNSIAQCH